MDKKLIRIFAAYYLFCGASGVLVPASWYWAGGLSPVLPHLLVRITAVLLLAIGLAFWASLNRAVLLPGVVFVAFWGSLLDIVAVVAGVVADEISLGKGGAFVVVDAIVIAGLSKLFGAKA